MESKLEEARKIINEVDTEMAELFTKRMKAAEMVFDYRSECRCIIEHHNSCSSFKKERKG